MNSIYDLKNYGKITINLKEIMKKKKVSKNKLANMIGTDNNTINRYYNNEIIRIDADILARICFVLECNIEEIIKYEKD